MNDHLLGYLFGLILAPAAVFVYWLIHRSPRRWWIWIWALSVPWQIGSVYIWPIIVAPTYNDFRRLEDTKLRDDLITLAEKAGIPNVDVYQVDSSRRTTRLNAYFSGIGPSKRIVIYDNTLKILSPDEIEAIMGHEIGHYVLRHTLWNIIFGIVGAFVILWILAHALPRVMQKWGKQSDVCGIEDIGGLPMLMTVVYFLLLIQTPIESAISRSQERAADRFGLELVGKNEAAARAFIQFVHHDFSDPDPPKWIVWWSYSHPPLKERVEFALNYKRQTQ